MWRNDAEVGGAHNWKSGNLRGSDFRGLRIEGKILGFVGYTDPNPGLPGLGCPRTKPPRILGFWESGGNLSSQGYLDLEVKQSGCQDLGPEGIRNWGWVSQSGVLGVEALESEVLR